MKFFPKETQPNGFRKETSGHQENQVALDGKGKKKKKTPQDCNSPIYSSSNRRAKTEKYRKRNAGSIPLRP